MRAMKWAGLTMLMMLLSIMAACSSMEPHEELLAKAAVQSATVRFIEADSDAVGRAENVISAIDTMFDASDLDETFTLADLEARAREVIPWSELTPQDAVLVEALIGYVRVELEGRTEIDIDAPSLTVEMQEVLSWVRDAASLYVNRG